MNWTTHLSPSLLQIMWQHTDSCCHLKWCSISLCCWFNYSLLHISGQVSFMVDIISSINAIKFTSVLNQAHADKDHHATSFLKLLLYTIWLCVCVYLPSKAFMWMEPVWPIEQVPIFPVSLLLHLQINNNGFSNKTCHCKSV